MEQEIGDMIIQEGPESEWKIVAPWQSKLVEENQKLVFAMANRQIKKHVGDDVKDYIGAGMIGLTKAAIRFDKTKGFKFSTFACRCIINEIKNHKARTLWIKPYRQKETTKYARSQPRRDSSKFLAARRTETEKRNTLPDISELLKTGRHILTARQFRILELMSTTKMTGKEIADIIGVPHRQNVSSIYKTVIRKLKKHYAESPP